MNGDNREFVFHYILKDHLGSWTAIADEDGKVFSDKVVKE